MAPASVRADTDEARAPIKLRLGAEGVVKLARVICNEDARPLRPVTDGGTGGYLTMDALAIAQTVHDWARTHGVSHIEALHRLAPHVTGRKPALLRRHTVYGSLPAFGELRPAAWLDRDGDWEGVHGTLWARFRDAVRNVVRAGFVPPSAHPLEAWGCDADSHIAEARGLARADIPGTVNAFWYRPPRVLDAVLASAVRR